MLCKKRGLHCRQKPSAKIIAIRSHFGAALDFDESPLNVVTRMLLHSAMYALTMLGRLEGQKALAERNAPGLPLDFDTAERVSEV